MLTEHTSPGIEEIDVNVETAEVGLFKGDSEEDDLAFELALDILMLTLGVATDEKEDWDEPALEKLRDGWMVGSNSCDDIIVCDVDTDFPISVELTLETCIVVVGIDVGNVWHRSLTGQRQRYPSGFTTQRWEHLLLPLVQE